MGGSSNVPLWLVFVLELMLVVQRVQCYDSTEESSGTMEDDERTCSCWSPTTSTHMTCQPPIDECFDGANVTKHQGMCYKFFTEVEMSRNNSQLECIKRHSHLVYIETEDEHTFLTNTTKMLTGGDFWIGLTPLYFAWEDGSPVLPDLFPISDSGGSCFYLSISGLNSRIVRGSCWRVLSFICEPPDAECSFGLLSHGNSCYKIYTSEWSARSWWSARSQCSDSGGHLLYIESKDELNAVLGNITNGDYWIGDITRPLGWMDGALERIDLAATSDSIQGNRCFRLRRQYDNGAVTYEVNDHNCNRDYNFICERQGRPMSSSRIAHYDVSSCPSSLPVDLIKLGRFGSLCIYILPDASSPPVLVDCDSLVGIDECGCIREPTNPESTIKCSCGFCDLVIDVISDDTPVDEVWPSEFTCTCSNKDDLFNVSISNGEFSCSGDFETARTTTRTTTRTTDGISVPAQTKWISTGAEMSSTSESLKSSTEVGGDGGETGRSASTTGTSIGLSLALIFVILALLAAILLWKRRGKRNRQGAETSLASNSNFKGSDTLTVNPTYGCDERPHGTDIILKPPGAAVPKTKPQNASPDVERKKAKLADGENYTALAIPPEEYTVQVVLNDGEVYTAIEPDGYTPYKPQPKNGDYTTLKGTRHEPESGIKEPTSVKWGPGGALPHRVENPESESIDVVAPRAVFGVKFGPLKTAAKPKSNDYVDVDAPPVMVADPGKTTSQSKQSNEGDYVSVDSPSVTFPVSPEEETNDDETDSNYYFKLQKLDEDYNTYEGLNNITTPPTDNEYNTFNRAADKHPNTNVPTDESAYSIASIPGPQDNDYSTLDRAGNRQPSDNAQLVDGTYSVITGPSTDDAYSTFDRRGNKQPRAPTDESVYNLPNLSGDGNYNILDRHPRADVVTNEDSIPDVLGNKY